MGSTPHAICGLIRPDLKRRSRAAALNSNSFADKFNACDIYVDCEFGPAVRPPARRARDAAAGITQNGRWFAPAGQVVPPGEPNPNKWLLKYSRFSQCFAGRSRPPVFPPINLFYEGIGPKSQGAFPKFEPLASVFDKVARAHPLAPFQRSQTDRPHHRGNRVEFSHQIFLGFKSSRIIPPTRATAPTTGGIKWLVVVAMCSPKKSMGLPGVVKLSPE